MRTSHRVERVRELLKQEVDDIIRNRLKDPRVSGFITVTDVEVSRDLRHAKVFVSVLGPPEKQSEVIEGLTNASGFVRSELGRRLRMKFIPEVVFELDHTLEEADRVLRLIDQVAKERREREGAEGEESGGVGRGC